MLFIKEKEGKGFNVSRKFRQIPNGSRNKTIRTITILDKLKKKKKNGEFQIKILPT